MHHEDVCSFYEREIPLIVAKQRGGSRWKARATLIRQSAVARSRETRRSFRVLTLVRTRQRRQLHLFRRDII